MRAGSVSSTSSSSSSQAILAAQSGNSARNRGEALLSAFQQCVEAIKNEKYAALKRLLEAQPLSFNLDAQGEEGKTLLHHAVRIAGKESCLEIVKSLLELGSDVNIKNDKGQPSFFYAAYSGKHDILVLLCKNGADIRAKDQYGKTVLHYAIAPTQAPDGSYIPKKDIIQTLCKQYRADPNPKDNQGQTPLHLVFIEFNKLSNPDDSIKKFFIEAIDTLLQVGADETIIDKEEQKKLNIKNIISSIIPLRQLTFEGASIAKHGPSLEGALPWKNIPKFALITGRNGAGKSHLLAYTEVIMKTKKPEIHYIYKPPREKIQSSSSAYAHLKTILDTYYTQKISSLFPHSRCVDLGKISGGHDIKWPIQGRVILDTAEQSTTNLVLELNTLLKKLFGESEKTLQIDYCGFPLDYRGAFQSKSPQSFTFQSEMKLVRMVKGSPKPIEHEELSSGERLILDIFCWQFYAEKATEEDTFKKISLLLLDEPDRHFDPELSKIFMGCLQYLVEKRGIQVIMTTHRTDTLAYAPEGSIFTIEKDKRTTIPRIQPINQLHALFKLTPNLRDITNFHIKVYTEAFDDATFYGKVYHQLLKLCETHREKKTKIAFNVRIGRREEARHEILSRRFQLSFYSVSLEKSGKSGGDSIALQAIQREQRALNNIKRLGIKALIDPAIEYPLGVLDADKNSPTGNHTERLAKFSLIKSQIKFTKRYNLENYLYDPVILFSVLNEKAINYFVKDTELAAIARDCRAVITGNGPVNQAPFDEYFKYFTKELILYEKYFTASDDELEKEREKFHRTSYYYLPNQVQQGKKRGLPYPLEELSNRLNINTSLPKKDRENKALESIINQLLTSRPKQIPLFSTAGVEIGTITYPGLFLYANGHNLEACFQARICKKENFKKALIEAIIDAEDMALPKDLVETIFELNSQVRRQANAILKP
jgi:energy-coupling factor transporter ATP-binding protein EcfA2